MLQVSARGMDASKSHTCAACGGSGCGRACGIHWGYCHCALDARGDCPVCLGSGRISDVIPARDAMADSETWFSILSLYWPSGTLGPLGGIDEDAFSELMIGAVLPGRVLLDTD